MSLLNRGLLVIFLCTALVPVAQAADPTQLYEKEGAANFDFFSQSIAGLGDLNGDGHADFAVGTPYGSAAAGGFAGYVVVYSGATGDVMYRIEGQTDIEHRGIVRGLGDLNGDGTPDFGIGASAAIVDVYGAFFPSGPGSIKVYSGKTGLPLYEIAGSDPQHEFGRAFAGVGDVNGDGKSDIVVGTAFVTVGTLPEAGAIQTFSGADGSLIRRIDGNDVEEHLGLSVAGTGDVNRDGVPDIVAGEPGPFGRTHSGAVIVYSGATGTEIYRIRGEAPSDRLGWSVDGAGDIDGDGIPDFIAGAVEATLGIALLNGMVKVFSGATGEVIYRLGGVSSYDRFGASVAGAGDVDGDGRDDFIVGAPLARVPGQVYGNYYGAAYVFSGRTGSILFDLAPPAWEIYSTGTAVASAGDVNGDGRADVLISAPFYPSSFNPVPGELMENGYAWVYALPAPVVAVNIDVRPGECPNVLNLSSRGKLPVALLGGDGFDPARVDPGSIRLNGVAPIRAAVTTKDIAAANPGGSEDCRCNTLPPDGFPDLVFWFDVPAIAATLRTPGGGPSAAVTLTGTTMDGARITGTDCVRLGRGGNRDLVSIRGNGRGAGEFLVDYRVPEEGASVRITIYSVTGRRVAELRNGPESGGEHTVRWDGRDTRGARAAAGIYFVKTEVAAELDVSKVTILH